jgi:hypothetical protein
MSTQLDPLSLSADLLYTVKTEGDPDWLRTQLMALEQSRLDRALSSRERRLSFWLNCYNAYAQLLLEETPELLEGGPIDRWKFFGRDRIAICGVWLSLSDIKHGMLRGSKHPWGLGYVPRPLPSPFERQFRLERCDPRIHFAVSCGGEHSPPVAVYSAADVDEELDIAIRWFLEETVSYDPDVDAATIPQLFRRYRGDFSGTRGIREFLRRYDAIPTTATPSLEYERVGRNERLELEDLIDR